MKRRTFLGSAAAVLAAGGVRAQPEPALTVVKSPTCGCCAAWVRHMRDAGFAVEVFDVGPDELEGYKRMAGLPGRLWSCHTARIDGYVIEGHVPAGDVKRLLAERPDALGLAVPGMPAGSPGMEMGDRRDAYETLLVLADGTTRVFTRHG